MNRPFILDKYRSHYEYIYYSPEWRDKRAEAIAAWKKAGKDYCVVCWGKREVVNHLNYETIGREDVWKDLCPMCNNCHHKFHFEGRVKLRYEQYRGNKRLRLLIFRCALDQTLLYLPTLILSAFIKSLKPRLRPVDAIWYGILTLVG